MKRYFDSEKNCIREGDYLIHIESGEVDLVHICDDGDLGFMASKNPQDKLVVDIYTLDNFDLREYRLATSKEVKEWLSTK